VVFDGKNYHIKPSDGKALSLKTIHIVKAKYQKFISQY